MTKTITVQTTHCRVTVEKCSDFDFLWNSLEIEFWNRLWRDAPNCSLKRGYAKYVTIKETELFAMRRLRVESEYSERKTAWLHADELDSRGAAT